MSSKNLPKHSQLILIVVGFLVTMYLLVVGFSYLKSWNDFKPYHKLAVELNDGLGGGFKVYEHKNCDITISCPYVELSKNSTETVGAPYIDKVRNYFTSEGFSAVGTTLCSSRIENQCTISGVKDGLVVSTSTIKGTIIELRIYKQ